MNKHTAHLLDQSISVNQNFIIFDILRICIQKNHDYFSPFSGQVCLDDFQLWRHKYRLKGPACL